MQSGGSQPKPSKTRVFDRLAHCSLCNAASGGDTTPTPSEGLPFYNLLIRACCRLGDRRRADDWLQRLLASGLQADVTTFLPLALSCADAGDVEEINRYISIMTNMGVPANSCVLHAVLKAHAVRRDFAGAQNVLAAMQHHGIPISEFTYHILLHACAKTGRLADAERYVAEMENAGMEPSVTTYNCMLNVCIKGDNAARARMWFDRMNDMGIEPNIVTHGTLCKFYAADGDVQGVEQVMDNVEAIGQPLTIHFYSSLLLACERARPRNKDGAEDCYRRMIHRGVSTSSMYNRFVRLLGRGRVVALQSEAQQHSPSSAGAEDVHDDVVVIGALSL